MAGADVRRRPAASSWCPVDLDEVLAGDDVPAPTVLARSDGVQLLYAGRTHQFVGESESMKTWCGLFAAGQILQDEGRVLWIDFEDCAAGAISRLRALGVGDEAIRCGFVYLCPEERLCSSGGQPCPAAAGFDVLLGCGFELAVIDGVTNAMSTEGLDLMSNRDVAEWLRRLPNHVATKSGAATVMIDHVTKSAETRGRYAIGGQHKLAALTGAAYSFSVAKPFYRATSDDVEGRVNISVTKDRPGYVRSHTVGDRIGTLTLVSSPNGDVRGSIDAAGGCSEPADDDALVHRVAAFLEQQPGATKSAIEKEIGGKAGPVRAAIALMSKPARAWIRIEQNGRSHHAHLTAKGAEELLGRESVHPSRSVPTSSHEKPLDPVHSSPSLGDEVTVVFDAGLTPCRPWELRMPESRDGPIAQE